MVYDGTSTQTVYATEYGAHNPKVSGNTIVWHGGDGNGDNEIFQATLVPEPSSLYLLALAAVTLPLALGRRRRGTAKLPSV